MATEIATNNSAESHPFTPMAGAALAVGWLIPGGGHLIQKKWGRGVLLMVSIVTLFVLGLGMQGKIYAFNTGDLLDMLGFIGDIGSGALYLISQAKDLGQGTIFRATADYGTKFLIVAGLLNVISAIDAYHIAIGKKS
jgi:hypothetical protein